MKVLVILFLIVQVKVIFYRQLYSLIAQVNFLLYIAWTKLVSVATGKATLPLMVKKFAPMIFKWRGNPFYMTLKKINNIES